MSAAIAIASDAQLKKDDVLELEVEFKSSVQSMADVLLRLYEGKAHKAFRFPTFEAYCLERLGFNVSERTIANRLTQARVRRTLLLAAKDPESVPAEIPVVIANEFNKLPKSEWTGVYEEYKGLDKVGVKGDKDKLQHLSRIVRKRLRDLVPKGVGASPKAAQPTKEKAHSTTPVVAARYDGEDDQNPDGIIHTPEGFAANASKSEIEAAVAPHETEVYENVVELELALYGSLVQVLRDFVACYGSDGEGLNEAHKKAIAILDKLDGVDGDGRDVEAA